MTSFCKTKLNSVNVKLGIEKESTTETRLTAAMKKPSYQIWLLKTKVWYLFFSLNKRV